MEPLAKKVRETSRGFTYTYYATPISSGSKPALVLCHGWPDCAELWATVIPALLDLGHPLIVPDLLGYAGTSKPTDIQAFNSKGMTDDIYEIADAEEAKKIIPVGHDWGSYFAQRLFNWRPERCAGLVLLNVAYQPPSHDKPFDLEEAMQLTEKYWGYPAFAYWDVFAADDGPKLLLENVETLFHLLHWEDPTAMKQVFCTRGAMRSLLRDGKPDSSPLKPYATAPGFKEAWITRMKRDTFESPQCWYKALARNVQYETEKLVPEENFKVDVPCLYIGATNDPVCRPEVALPYKHLLPDLEEHMLEANHWITFEQPKRVGELMQRWLKKQF